MKYIHYCWFGDKPLPKLAKKCIQSWKKYLGDYEILKWSEENVDINECQFVKEAYENKKWAFVADYARTKALKEYGGIYFDTDMEVIKNIDELLKNNTFLGIEDTGYVAVGVWYEKEKNAELPTKLLSKYKSIESFDINKINDYSIPRLITKILEEYGLKHGSTKIQILNDNIYIYPRDYFYPYSYNWQNNIFTENTCMIHYYDASWIPFIERLETNMVRKLGKNNTYKILSLYRKIKYYIKKTIKTVLYPLIILKRLLDKKKLITKEYLIRVSNTINEINKKNNKDYIVIHNANWLGVTSATKELFNNTIDCGEIYRKKDAKRIADTILNNNIKQVIFSSMSIGYKDLAIILKKKNKKIKIKSFWHGSQSQVLDYYGWKRNTEIIKLHKRKIIDVMGTCKKSLIDFYKNQNYHTCFLTNKVEVDVEKAEKKVGDKPVIGIYAAKCDDWRKNMYSQMAAVSLLDNAVIDMVPLNDEAIDFAKLIGVKISGEKKPLERDKLLLRMAKNDINLYVTYSECSPMLPLESFEVNVPCICGNNCHYFKNSKLEEYIVVNNEESPEDIKNKIELCLNNKNKIKKLYDEFKKKNLKEAKEDTESFLKM